jgi:hypothetical protein
LFFLTAGGRERCSWEVWGTMQHGAQPRSAQDHLHTGFLDGDPSNGGEEPRPDRRRSRSDFLDD